jgi:hypothetical protein
MKAKSNLKDFEKELKQLTTKESFFFLTPLDFSGKPFCGSFDHSTFDLTRNSMWQHIRAISIKGSYRREGDVTEVEYEVGVDKFSRIFARVVFILLAVGLNIIVLVSHRFDASDVIALNFFLLAAWLLLAMMNWISKKIVEERFETEFEIVDPLTMDDNVWNDLTIDDPFEDSKRGVS